MSMQPKRPVPPTAAGPCPVTKGSASAPPEEVSIPVGDPTEVASSAEYQPPVEFDDFGHATERVFTQEHLRALNYPTLLYTEREDARAWLREMKAEALGKPHVEDKDSGSFYTAHQLKDGSIWVEIDESPNSPETWRRDYRLNLAVPPGLDQSVIIDQNGDLEILKTTNEPPYGATQGTYATFDFVTGGDLVIRPTRQFFEEFDGSRRTRKDHQGKIYGIGTDQLLWDVLEYPLVNGWQCVDSVNQGGGGFSITCEGGSVIGDGKVEFYPYTFTHTNYVTEDPIKALFTEGRVVFELENPQAWMDASDIRDWKEETNEHLVREGVDYQEDPDTLCPRHAFQEAWPSVDPYVFLDKEEFEKAIQDKAIESVATHALLGLDVDTMVIPDAKAERIEIIIAFNPDTIDAAKLNVSERYHEANLEPKGPNGEPAVTIRMGRPFRLADAAREIQKAFDFYIPYDRKNIL